MGLTVVAFYGPKPDALGALIGSVQQAFAESLGAAFRPRPVDDVHATVIGLEDAPGCADDVAAFLAAELRRAPLDLRFGSSCWGRRPSGAAAVPCASESALLDGERAVVIGWPVEHGRPTARLGELRRDCARFGVIHKYHRGTTALDPDAYLVVGDADVPREGVAEAVRATALGRPTSGPADRLRHLGGGVRGPGAAAGVVNLAAPFLTHRERPRQPEPGEHAVLEAGHRADPVAGEGRARTGRRRGGRRRGRAGRRRTPAGRWRASARGRTGGPRRRCAAQKRADERRGPRTRTASAAST